MSIDWTLVRKVIELTTETQKIKKKRAITRMLSQHIIRQCL